MNLLSMYLGPDRTRQ